MKDILRRVRLSPYRKGQGPTFSLTLWDTGRTQHRVGRFGCPELGYRLTMRENGRSVVLFEGEDFGAGCGTAIDSDAAVAGILGFLTLRPGDTDDEYFEKYTEAQREFCDRHAEFLACEVMSRFGEF